MSGYLQAATLTLAVSPLHPDGAADRRGSLLRDPAVLRAIAAAWRQSLAAGFLGAFASEMWFLAFAIKGPAAVRTLGLVEILIAGLVSRSLFRPDACRLRDIVGMVARRRRDRAAAQRLDQAAAGIARARAAG